MKRKAAKAAAAVLAALGAFWLSVSAIDAPGLAGTFSTPSMATPRQSPHAPGNCSEIQRGIKDAYRVWTGADAAALSDQTTAESAAGSLAYAAMQGGYKDLSSALDALAWDYADLSQYGFSPDTYPADAAAVREKVPEILDGCTG